LQYKSRSKKKTDFWTRICYYITLLLLTCSNSIWETSIKIEDKPYKFTSSTNDSPGLQYEVVGKAKLYKSSWTINTYFDLKNLDNSFNINKAMLKSIKMYVNISTSVKLAPQLCATNFWSQHIFCKLFAKICYPVFRICILTQSMQKHFFSWWCQFHAGTTTLCYKLLTSAYILQIICQNIFKICLLTQLPTTKIVFSLCINFTLVP